MPVNYSTISLKNWQDFRQFIPKFSENWAFRGQANASWVLNNAIERTAFIHFYKGIEANFVSEFQRGARNYLSRDETPGHLIEWLALMQHHGAPTRLLDLTKSPFIAAYFAFEISDDRPDHRVSVWCINTSYLRTRAIELLSEHFGEALAQSSNLINESLFEKIFYENDRQLVFPVEPFRMNKRYSLQQSIFVSTGTSEAPFMQQILFLGEDLDKAVVKIELPASCRSEALRDLQKMNLHRASLFPDLDGYAMSLRLRYECMKSPQDALTETISKMDDPGFPFIP
ncbi:MAG TPA: FRG domain-containing protein [Flavisolibacter sp.]